MTKRARFVRKKAFGKSALSVKYSEKEPGSAAAVKYLSQ